VISHAANIMAANIMLVRHIVATDAMGYVTSVAQAIVDAKADYVL
jgi:predicted transposase YbfD/YdcC